MGKESTSMRESGKWGQYEYGGERMRKGKEEEEENNDDNDDGEDLTCQQLFYCCLFTRFFYLFSSEMYISINDNVCTLSTFPPFYISCLKSLAWAAAP